LSRPKKAVVDDEDENGNPEENHCKGRGGPQLTMSLTWASIAIEIMDVGPSPEKEGRDKETFPS